MIHMSVMLYLHRFRCNSIHMMNLKIKSVISNRILSLPMAITSNQNLINSDIRISFVFKNKSNVAPSKTLKILLNSQSP